MSRIYGTQTGRGRPFRIIEMYVFCAAGATAAAGFAGLKGRRHVAQATACARCERLPKPFGKP